MTAKGQAQHHHWGQYSALIGLQFPEGTDLEKAIEKLSAGIELGSYRDACGRSCASRWETIPAKNVVFVTAAEPALSQIVDRLASFGAEKKAILSCSKSIDFGQPFTFTIPE